MSKPHACMLCSMQKDKILPCMVIQILIGQEMLWIEEVQVVMHFLWEVLWSVFWQSKKQPTVALSRTEAKYRGAALATCEES